MIKKIRYFVLRSFYKIINPIKRVYWFILRPRTRGAKALIVYGGKVLLVRISYAHMGWTLPGGGVDQHESFRDAALREAKEEVGISASNAEFFYEYENTHQYKRDTVQCFAVSVETPDFKIDELEIAEAGWFSFDALPANARPHLVVILKAYQAWVQTV